MKQLVIILVLTLVLATQSFGITINEKARIIKTETLSKNNFLSKNQLEIRDYPGKFPTFLFSFIISFLFGYTLYFAGVGILTVLWVYLATHSKTEMRKAIWGFVIGALLGIALRLYILYS